MSNLENNLRAADVTQATTQMVWDAYTGRRIVTGKEAFGLNLEPDECSSQRFVDERLPEQDVRPFEPIGIITEYLKERNKGNIIR